MSQRVARKFYLSHNVIRALVKIEWIIKHINQNPYLCNMIELLLKPLICERFSKDEKYREGHLRVINALPERKVLGLHTPEIKQISKLIFQKGCDVFLTDETSHPCSNGADVLDCFEQVATYNLFYEETVIWGYLINHERCSLEERLNRLKRYITILDNWAVCDSFCANAKWMKLANKNILWHFLLPYFLSTKEFEVRFAIVTAMTYFLDEAWLSEVFKQINNINITQIHSRYTTIKGKPKYAQQGTVQGESPYYVRMGIAWLLATSLYKYPNETRCFVKTSTLPNDVIKLYIRKARESFRTRDIEAL